MAQEPSMASTKKVWDSVNLYAIRCIKCSNWRIIPTKEKYEEIRERISREPFMCDTALEWCPNISCENESDITQDNNLYWAMDKPHIPQTPLGWQRIIRLKAGGTKFADIYYVAPSNKRLRSMNEIDRYLSENPKYQQERISISRFSFKAPVPLDDNYVSKRRRHAAALSSVAPMAASLAAREESAEGHSVEPVEASAETRLDECSSED